MDAETFKTRFAEAFAERMTAFADELSDTIVDLISDEDDDAVDDASKGRKDERSAPAPSAAATAAKLRSIEAACKRNGRHADFKDLKESGASLEELRALAISAVRTSEVEIDTTQKPASGKRGGGLVSFSDSAKTGKAAK